MKHFVITLLFALLSPAPLPAVAEVEEKLPEATVLKREARKNLTIKEWNTDAHTKTRWLDRQTTYDAFGRKVEEIEYTQHGQKWRETFEYGENDKIAKEVLYDERNRPKLIRKYEYDASLRKVRQYNYAPNGKLQTIKVFEYVIAAE